VANNLTAQSYSLLLNALAPDKREAEAAFVKLRDSLVRFFELKGDNDPIEAADETLDRVSSKLSQSVAIEQVTNYSFGVARLVFLENLRSTQRSTNALAEYRRESERSVEDEYIDGYAPMRDCFSELSDESRNLLTSYFADLPRHRLDEERQQIAVKRGISLNGLRLKIFRLRRQLEDCVRRNKIN
jgi:hypothetical protein